MSRFSDGACCMGRFRWQVLSVSNRVKQHTCSTAQSSSDAARPRITCTLFFTQVFPTEFVYVC
jgi:hypothetical protein